jgi:hypothetical protein
MLILAVLVLAAAAPLGAQTPAEPHISHAEARTLVLAALRDEGVDIDSPKFGLFDRPDNEYFPDWFQFDAHMNTEFVFHRIGGYAVLPTTTETWQEESCKRLNGKRVRGIRATLQKRYGLANMNSSKRPFCAQEDQ